jgi:hypothetical protein
VGYSLSYTLSLYPPHSQRYLPLEALLFSDFVKEKNNVFV